MQNDVAVGKVGAPIRPGIAKDGEDRMTVFFLTRVSSGCVRIQDESVLKTL